MDTYSLQKLAQAKQQEMLRSLPIVSEFGEHIVPAQPGWLSAKVGMIAAHLRPSLRNQQPATRPALTTSSPSPFLREQLREDSNRELDWLWAASQVMDVQEIRYCLERALYINPKNRDTQHALSQLAARRATDETSQGNQEIFAQVSEN